MEPTDTPAVTATDVKSSHLSSNLGPKKANDDTQKASTVKAAEAVDNVTKQRARATDVAADALSVDRLMELVEELQEALPDSANTLRFTVDEVLNRPIVTVIDKESGRLIRQLPGEEVVRAARNIELMRGILFDQIG